jgi:hypothetical protein
MSPIDLERFYRRMRATDHVVSEMKFRITGQLLGGGRLKNELLLTFGVVRDGEILPAFSCRFLDVSNLKLATGPWPSFKFVDLRIEGVEDRQWEGVRYHVYEAEEAALSLDCNDIQFPEVA